MSILIIGGAFLVALLALVGLVVLVRQEVQETTRKQQAEANKVSAPAVNTKITTPLQPVAQQDAVANEQPVPAVVEAKVSTFSTQERLPVVASGQFNDFVTELHTLHEQAQEIEQRLAILTEMVARIQRVQNSNNVSISEDSFHTEDLTPITR